MRIVIVDVMVEGGQDVHEKRVFEVWRMYLLRRIVRGIFWELGLCRVIRERRLRDVGRQLQG